MDRGRLMGNRRAYEKRVAQKIWPQPSLIMKLGSSSSVQKRSKICGIIDLI